MAFLFPQKQSLGGALGTGLGSGLEALANQKLQQIQQRNQQQQLSSALQQFLPEQQRGQVAGLAALPENLQQIGLKELLAQPGKQAYAQALGLGGQQNPEGKAFNPSQSLPNLTEKQATEIAKMQQKERLLTAKERSEAFKATKAERKDFVDKAKAGRQSLEDLNRIEELEKEGLPSAGYSEFLKRSGLDIPTLQGATGEEFNKITANFIKNAKSYYGARVSNFELESFLKTIPSLSQSPEGRKRVIANLKNIARLEIEGGKAAREIIKNNKNIPPLDLIEQVDERIQKKLINFLRNLNVI